MKKRFLATVILFVFLLTYFFFSMCSSDKIEHNCECGECVVCALRETFQSVKKIFMVLALAFILSGCIEFLGCRVLLDIYRKLFSQTPVFLKVCLLN